MVPKLGESVIEATITRWLKQEGDAVQADDPIAEIATDKVDSEIVSTATGRLVKKLFNEGDVVSIGAPLAVIETDNDAQDAPVSGTSPREAADPAFCRSDTTVAALSGNPVPAETVTVDDPVTEKSSGTRFYSPLVRNIARQENIPFAELDAIAGTGKDDRLTKQDLMNYLLDRKAGIRQPASPPPAPMETAAPVPAPAVQPILPGENRIVEMDRIRQLIATHMVRSVQTSPHVTSFQEVDMSRIVTWREKNKGPFEKRENEKLTYTPVFIDAIARAVRDYPQVNVSVDGTKIVMHRNINIGMAVSLPDFNLIVPVIRQAGEKNLLGIVKTVNDLARRARAGKLVPDEITGGTISLTNLGSFGTLMGTPIINQPQTAIVAVGAIKKRAVVVETPEGDVIAIRPVMMMSVTYDHRVIDGSLGGQFLNRIVEILESFDPSQPI